MLRHRATYIHPNSPVHETRETHLPHIKMWMVEAELTCHVDEFQTTSPPPSASQTLLEGDALLAVGQEVGIAPACS